MIRFLCALFTLLFLSFLPILATASQQPMPVDQAFSISAKPFGSDTVLLHWTIAPKHYLYRERFSFKPLKPEQASVGSILLPLGIPKEDTIFGKYQVFAKDLTIPVPLIHADSTDTQLQVKYQGCSEEGYCYPPTTRVININFTAGTAQLVASPKPPAAIADQQDKFIRLLSGHHLITILLGFLGFGILLSFTPCVLPMLPILSGIIVGHQKTITTGKAFRLSVVYVLSMALTYAIAGVLVGMIGGSVQATLQKPWVLILSSLLFVLLALSFFGLYQIKLPARFEEKIANLSRHQKSGHYAGVAIMGCLASLIISPCVTPALVGVLSYIGQSGNALFGGIALFALGLGMGFPLLLVGAAGGKLLPKAGAWMKTVESVFGVLFLGMAIWILSRIIPAQITLVLWASLLIISAIYLGAFSSNPVHGWQKLWKGSGIIMLVYGILMIVGAAQGNIDPLRPLSLGNTPHVTQQEQQRPLFVRVKTPEDVASAIQTAKGQGRPTLLDFYADWCVSCIEMERSSFRDPEVLAALEQFIRLKADVTHNNPEDKSMMQHYQVVAPPTLLFFSPKGDLMTSLTLVGKVDKQVLLAHLHRAGMIQDHNL